jgi:hypothetical protein
MSLKILAALVTRFGLDVLTALGVVTGLVQNAAQEHVTYTIEGSVVSTSLAVASPAHGLVAIEAKAQAALDQSIANGAALVTIYDAITALGGPVTLPTVPPSGYGSLDAAGVADAVWNTPLTVFPATAGDALRQTARHSNPVDDFDSSITAGVFKVSAINFTADGIFPETLTYPIFDPTDLVASETLLATLTRQNPTWTVSVPWSPQTFVGLRDSTTPGSVTFTTTIDEADFVAYKKNLVPALADLPPVWPGLGFVTLGSPVALDLGLTVPGPLDGVIVNISAVPTKQGFFQFDTMRAWRNVGAVAFVDDNGEVEAAQTLAFDHAVYCPRTMVQASEAVIRCSAGVTGTVTPWVRVVP